MKVSQDQTCKTGFFFLTVFYFALICSQCAYSEGSEGTSKTLRFVEGTINVSQGTNHARRSTDLAGSMISLAMQPAIDELMNGISNIPSPTNTTQGNLGPQGNPPPMNTGYITADNVNLVLITNPDTGMINISSQAPSQAPQETLQNGQVVILQLSDGQGVAPTGTIRVANAPRSIAQEVRASQPTVAEQLAASTPSFGLGIGLDTFFVPPGSENTRFEANMDLIWSFSKGDIDHYNTILAVNQLGNILLPLGSIRLETKETRFVREVGFRCDIGIDLKWRNNWHNNIIGLNITDIGMEINENDRDTLGAGDIDHSDTVNVSDIPGVVQGLVEKLTGVFSRAAGSAATREAGQSLAGKIFDNLEIGVLVTQTTYGRYVDIKFEVKAEGMDGKKITGISVEPAAARFENEGEDKFLSMRLPEGCPPIKKITLQVTEAKYSYKESANVEFGISAKYIPIELKTGPLTEGIGKYFQNDHTVAARDEDLPSFSVQGGPLVLIPFHGIVQDGQPPFGIEGVKLDIYARDNSFHKTEYTHPDGKFWGDFYIASDSGAPEVSITANKEGYPPGRYIVTYVNDQEGYNIKMLMTQENYIYVRGVVKDLEGNPIPEAEVHVSTVTDVWVATNAQGRFSLDKVVRSPKAVIYVAKQGYNFPVLEMDVADDEQGINTEVTASAQMPNVAKLKFVNTTGGLPPSVLVRRSSGKEFYLGMGQDGMLNVVVAGNSDTLDLSAFGFTMEPSQISVQFPGKKPGESVNREIRISSVWASSIQLSASKTSIETGGAHYNDDRPEEKASLSAIVKDSSGNPKQGVPVRFESVGTGSGRVKFSQEGLRPGCGYALSDSQGNAVVDIKAYNTLGDVVIKAAALDKYVITGKDSDQLYSSTVNVSIVPTTRISQPEKPTASVVVYTNDKAVIPSTIPTVEKDGEFVFHLSYSLGNPAVSPIYASGTVTGYKLAFSKNGGTWQEEAHDGAPPLSVPRRFAEKGQYKVGFQVKETYGEEDTWSDRAEQEFAVVEFMPPQVSLTLPSNTGIVNLPLEFSFNVNGSCLLQNISLEFGDNQQDIVIDAGLLSGRTSWSGSFHHTYRQEGSYQIRLRAVDQNGKSAEDLKDATIQPLSFLNDTTPPTGTVEINNGAASTADRTVVLEISGSDTNGAGIYRLRASNDGTNWGPWQAVEFSDDIPHPAISVQRAWQLSEGAGTKTVHVQLKDAAENVSSDITTSIQLTAATLAPSGALPQPVVTETSYNNPPAPYGSISVVARNGDILSLSLSATNDWAIIVNQMAFSFDGQNWTPWMEYQDSKEISIGSNTSAQNIYVVFADAAGGQSQTYAADIPQAVSQTAEVQEADVSEEQGSGQQDVTQGLQDEQGSDKNEGVSEDKKVFRDRDAGIKKSLSEDRVSNLTREETISGISKKRVEMQEEQKIDVSVEEIKVDEKVILGKESPVEIQLKNLSGSEAEKCLFTFEADDGFKETKKISLRPKHREKIMINWTPKVEGRQTLRCELQYDGDTDMSNNKASQRVEVVKAEEINIILEELSVQGELYVGKGTRIEATVKNDSDTDIRDCRVYFTAEDGFKADERIRLGAKARERVRFMWTPKVEGRQTIKAEVVCKDDINKSDNETSQKVSVKGISRDRESLREQPFSKKEEDAGAVDKSAGHLRMDELIKREEEAER